MVPKMGFKDPDQLAHGPIPLIWICRIPFYQYPTSLSGPDKDQC